MNDQEARRNGPLTCTAVTLIPPLEFVGKKFTLGLMGRKEYEEYRTQFEAHGKNRAATQAHLPPQLFVILLRHRML